MKHYKPSGYPDLMPYLTVKDMKASIEFYQKAFGFEIAGEISYDENKNPIHAELRRGEARFMISPEGAYGGLSKAPITSNLPAPAGFYLYCENVNDLYIQATKAGAISLNAPDDMFWGDRICRLLDINNYPWALATTKL
jgi:uncharacterized glyoxalase superfamily protein PhnB